MCGNRARCFARFVNGLSGSDLEKVSFEKDPEGTYQEVTLLGPADFTVEGTTEN